MKKPRPTHINVIFRPKAKDIAIEGAYDGNNMPTTDGRFTVEQAKEIYDYMVLKAKEFKTTAHVWKPTKDGGNTPVVKFNKYDNAPYIALVSKEEAQYGPTKATKVVL